MQKFSALSSDWLLVKEVLLMACNLSNAYQYPEDRYLAGLFSVFSLHVLSRVIPVMYLTVKMAMLL